MKNDKPVVSSQALKLELNHELFTDNSAFSFGPPGRDAGCARLAGADQSVRSGISDLDQEDKTENELSLKHGFRLLSSYQVTETEKLWIVTEADRSVTTLLLPDEY